MSYHHNGGRHELGQNFLVDRSIISEINTIVAKTTGPIVEIGAGDGALTIPMSRSGRPITAVEIDPRKARRVAGRTPDNVAVVNDDVLRFPFPQHPHVVVGNLPFHITTAVLRRVLATPAWNTAILLVQWEVARRRAGIGGATLMTASWWPWYEFQLCVKVPARAFRPVPSVDAGLLEIRRRETPLVADRKPYQEFVKHVFTGPGRGMADILRRTGRMPAGRTRNWLDREGIGVHALPKDLTARQWASLWNAVTR
ncbi:23S rRNA (adenine-N6)-dimethyltransferase [Herbihabitans rhizosphaerae]|uniref:23S rRNA (Adenine-N6)-dimethyltransferase n=1 Tax=Herbihabitans rhizosphaerae TaxID=1872711 RepID=A0A4Q7KAT0_9PSEU|nr:23S ribosomal RNA methyltransferase Erm [Herbihabitans rhizosphaerae]RZS29466.1 23S rRNA (adenine-N6)-dimethyltransferase [Herbihabitans rhizosphaerae]